jgi:hypothetical protein
MIRGREKLSCGEDISISVCLAMKVARSALPVTLAHWERAGVMETVMAAATHILWGGADAALIVNSAKGADVGCGERSEPHQTRRADAMRFMPHRILRRCRVGRGRRYDQGPLTPWPLGDCRLRRRYIRRTICSRCRPRAWLPSLSACSLKVSTSPQRSATSSTSDNPSLSIRSW